jgi:endonuclease/exonuclease/phosphatase (EEP) superfamily protein YafD
MKITLTTIFLAFVDLVTVTIFLVSALSFFGQNHFILDNLSNFRYQYLLMSLIAFLLSIVLVKSNKRYYIAAFLSIIAVLLNLVEVAPYTTFYKAEYSQQEQGVKVMLTNVLRSNNNYDKVIKLVAIESPDIIFFQEIDRAWLEKLRVLKKTYPYAVESPREDCFGIMVYSRLPITGIKPEECFHQDYSFPYITFNTLVNGQRIRFLSFHTPPPKTEANWKRRNNYLNFIAEKIKTEKTPAVVVGDLNVTLFSFYCKKLMSTGELIPARKNQGLYPTWPSSFIKPFRVPIDLILTTKEIDVLSFKTGPSIGSDHLPVIAVIRAGE